MRLHRFFIKEIVGDKTEVVVSSAELVNQIQRVFRLKESNSVIIFDGSGFDYECSIEGFTKDSVSLRVIKKESSRYMPSRDIYLYVAVVKKDTFEWIVEKATELGVTHIVPVMAERSEKKSLNEERLKKIAIEASEQSGRGDVPVIEKIVTLEEASSRSHLDDSASVIVLHTESEMFSSLFSSRPRGIFIGPEGGWSPREIEMFHKNNIDIYCLGKQVLRTETAVIVALSQIVFDN